MLPLLGANLAGLPLERYLEFPPRSRYIGHAPFSLILFIVLGFVVCLLLPWYFFGLAGMERRRLEASCPPGRIAPALALLAASWAIAWSRLGPLSWLQHHTFVLVWGSYIFLVDRILGCLGVSPFAGKRRAAAGLFFASACFWWLFEWLNRFVQNWTYHNVEHFSPLEYWFFATMSFATVLPAVLVTKELLKTLFAAQLAPEKMSYHPLHLLRDFWFPALVIGLCALFFLPRFPNELFPCLWLAPLLVLGVLSQRFAFPTFLDLKGKNDFVELVFWSLAGICCGVLWETWNYYSLAGWDYHIPYVGRIRIFGMPLLGYAGYLPFGVLCGLVCELLGWSRRLSQPD